MRTQISQLYEFGPFHLDVSERLLMRGERVVPLSPKVFDTLLVLVENSGRILGKDELMQAIWPDTFVEESNLTQNISQIRRALGEGAYIETIPRRGYRFIFQVQVIRREGQSSNGHGPTRLEVADLEPAAVAPEPVRPKAVGVMKWVIRFAIGLFLVTALLFVAMRVRPTRARTAFGEIVPAKLGVSGRAPHAAVSRDGRYLAYVTQDDAGQSLWIRQVTTSAAQMVAAADADFIGVTFAPDDRFLYYVARRKTEPTGRVYQIPMLGGAPKQLMSGVDSPVALSPDGQSLAFVRNAPASGETALITVRLDGSVERRLLTRRYPEALSMSGASWSADGNLIACAVASASGLDSAARVLAVSVADGSARPIGDRTWTSIGQVAWLDDNSAVIFSAWEESSSVYGNPLWLQTYPDGEVRQLTSDLTGYDGVSLWADSGELITRRIARVSRFWVAPVNGRGLDLDRARSFQSGFGDNFSEWLGLAWTPDGRLAYASQASGNLDLWIAAEDGRQPRQVTRDSAMDVLPVATADGRYLVFVSNRGGRSNLWRVDLDGGNLKQLTPGGGAISPSLSPDSQWVVYVASNDGHDSLWKVSIDGGPPIQLCPKVVGRPIVSPDGRWIAGYYPDGAANRTRVVVLPFAGGEPRVIEELAPTEWTVMQWSPDSRALTYIVTRQGVSNLWNQPIDGGPARPLTDFTTDQIFRFAWSIDGRRLAYERGQDLNDIVLISNRGKGI